MKLRLAYLFSALLLFSFALCGSNVAVAAEASKFRGFYVGMNSTEFAQAVARLDKDYLIRFSFTTERASAYAVITDKGSGVKECMYEKMTVACVFLEGIGTRDDVKQLVVRNPNKSETKVSGREEQYDFLNLSDPPPFSIKGLQLFPQFFEPNGMTLEDVSQYLLKNYQFVGNELFKGLDKGECVYCFVGLLKTGEKIVLVPVGGWRLEVGLADENFRRQFIQTTFR